MSSQALKELEDLEINLRAISAGTASVPSLSDKQHKAYDATSIISSAPVDPNNSWRDFMLVQKIQDYAVAPTKNPDCEASFILYSAEPVVVPAWGKAQIDTKISLALPNNTYARCVILPELAEKHDLEVACGVAPSGRQSLCITVRNLSDTPYQIQRADRFAQLILEQYKNTNIKEVKNIAEILSYRARRG